MSLKSIIELDTFVKEAIKYDYYEVKNRKYIKYCDKELYLDYSPKWILVHLLSNRFSTETNGFLGINIPDSFNIDEYCTRNNLDESNIELVKSLLNYVNTSSNVGWFLTTKNPESQTCGYIFPKYENYCVSSASWICSVSSINLIIDEETSMKIVSNYLPKKDYNGMALEIANIITNYIEDFKQRTSLQSNFIDDYADIKSIYFDYNIKDLNLDKLTTALAELKYNVSVLYHAPDAQSVVDLRLKASIDNLMKVRPHSVVLFDINDQNADNLKKTNSIKSFLLNYYNSSERIDGAISIRTINRLYELICELYIDSDTPWDIKPVMIKDKNNPDSKEFESTYSGGSIDKHLTLIFSIARLSEFCNECNINIMNLLRDFQLYNLFALINLTTNCTVTSPNETIMEEIVNCTTILLRNKSIPASIKLSKLVRDTLSGAFDYRLVVSRTEFDTCCLALTIPYTSNSRNVTGNSLPKIAYTSFSNFISHIHIDNAEYNDSDYANAIAGNNDKLFQNDVEHYYFNVDTLPNYKFEVLNTHDFASSNLQSFEYVDVVDLVLEGYRIVYNKYSEYLNTCYLNAIPIHGTSSPFRDKLIELKRKLTKPNVNNISSFIYYFNLLLTQMFTFYDKPVFLNDVVAFKLNGEIYIGVAYDFPKYNIMPTELGNGINYDTIQSDILLDIKILPDMYDPIPNSSSEFNFNRILNPEYKNTIQRVDKYVRNLGKKIDSFQYKFHNSKCCISLYPKELSEYIIAANNKYSSNTEIECVNITNYYNNNADTLSVEDMLKYSSIRNYIVLSMMNSNLEKNRLEVIPLLFNEQAITTYSLRYVDKSISPINCFGSIACHLCTTNYFKKRVSM